MSSLATPSTPSTLSLLDLVQSDEEDWTDEPLADISDQIARGIDLAPMIERLTIVDKGAQLRKLRRVMNWPQRHLVDHVTDNLHNGRPTRVIILKARQLGISTITEGIQFSLAMLVDNFRGHIISHESKSNEHLLGMTQRYYDTYSFRKMYTQTNKAANKVAWDPTNSRIGISTAKNLGSGRSLTVHFLHGSEVSFWPNADVLMSGLGQSIPKGAFSFVILESTANGMGNWFQSTWDRAVTGENDYTPMFFPWQTHPEYTGRTIGIDPVDPITLDDHELELARMFLDDRLGEENAAVLTRSMSPEVLTALRAPMTSDEVMSRLAWRRHVIANDLRGDTDLFLQEYPHAPSVAFLSTGRNIFPLAQLEPIYRPAHALVGDLLSQSGRLKFHEVASGPLKVFQPPNPNRGYIIGGDPTFTTSGDYACAQVLDRQTWEQVAVWRGRCTPGRFGEIMVRLGYWYNEALLAPESNKDGATTVGRIQGLDYPNIWERQVVDTAGDAPTNKLGWHTNARTKTEAIGNLQSSIYDRSLTIHDPHTFNELKNYVDLGMGKYGNANGEENDDTVMALAIAATVNHYESYQFNHPAPYDDTEQLRVDINAAMKSLGGFRYVGLDDVHAGGDNDDDW